MNQGQNLMFGMGILCCQGIVLHNDWGRPSVCFVELLPLGDKKKGNVNLSKNVFGKLDPKSSWFEENTTEIATDRWWVQACHRKIAGILNFFNVLPWDYDIWTWIDAWDQKCTQLNEILKVEGPLPCHLNQSLFVLTNNKAQMEFLNNLIPTVQDLAKFWSGQCVGKTRTRATLLLQVTLPPRDHVSVRRYKLLRLQFKGPEPVWFQSGGWIKCIFQGIYIAKLQKVCFQIPLKYACLLCTRSRTMCTTIDPEYKKKFSIRTW